MRIACPTCESVYDVPDAMLADGARMVRCVQCATEWTPTPMADAEPPIRGASADELAQGTDDAAADPQAQRSARAATRLSGYRARGEEALPSAAPPPPPQTRAGRGPLVGWVISVVLLIGLGAGAVSWRAHVMAAWPPSQRLYGAFGLR